MTTAPSRRASQASSRGQERAGKDVIDIELQDGATVADALEALHAQPALNGLLDSLPVAMAVYDMVKGIERAVTIEQVQLLEKTGGKSGEWHAGDVAPAQAPDTAPSPSEDATPTFDGLWEG